MATVANITAGFYTGAAFSLTFSFTEDVAGWAFSWKLQKDTGAVVLTKTMADGITIIGTFNADPAQNTQRVVVEIEPDDTTALKGGQYQHELKRIDADAQYVLAGGYAQLTKAIHAAVAA